MPADNFQLKLPSRVHFGRGQVSALAEICERRDFKRLALLTDSGVRDAGGLECVLDALPKSVKASVYDQIPPEPPVESVTAAMDALREAGPFDGMIGLGGGSVIDVSKIVAILLARSGDVESLFGVNQVKRRGLPTVMIPTTSGTGSEATGVAILTRSETGIKVGVADPCIVPDEAIVDPSLTDTLPQPATAAAGIDALVHAVEAYLATCATPLARGLSLEAAAAVAANLEVACEDGSNQTARDGLALGSHLAGISFANSSCCAVHALALPLGGRFHIPHGVVTGGLFAATMRHNSETCASDFQTLANAMNWNVDSAAEFVARIDQLAETVGVKGRLQSADVPADAVPGLADEAVAIRRLMDPNPRPVSVADATHIYQEALGLS